VLRIASAVVATALGALLAAGCLLAALFEAQGFGGERDAGPRPGYLLALALAFAICVAVPVRLWRAAWPLALGVAFAGVVLVLGVGFG
jgi:hypothetical protein